MFLISIFANVKVFKKRYVTQSYFLMDRLHDELICEWH